MHASERDRERERDARARARTFLALINGRRRVFRRSVRNLSRNLTSCACRAKREQTGFARNFRRRLSRRTFFFFLAIVFKNSHGHAPVLILRVDSWNRQLELAHILRVVFLCFCFINNFSIREFIG